MKCTKCNKEIENGAKFCTFCGAKKEEIKEEKPTDAPPVITVVPKASKKSEKKAKKEEKAPKNATLPKQKAKDKPKKEKAPKKDASKKDAPKEKQQKEKQSKEKSPKSKDRVNFFLLLLSLLCPPYFGVLITICTSAKKPKSSQVYGILTILSFIYNQVRNYVLTVLVTVLVIVGALCTLFFGAYLVLAELGYDISFLTSLFPTV